MSCPYPGGHIRPRRTQALGATDPGLGRSVPYFGFIAEPQLFPGYQPLRGKM